MYENDPIKQMLKRRGLTFISCSPYKNLIFPNNWNNEYLDIFYKYMRHYSFRLFLRDVIKKRDSFELTDLTKYCSKESAIKYLDFLKTSGIVMVKKGLTYELQKESVKTFGDTFEWFIAMLFEREFNCSALWGIRLKKGVGGDFDVIASVEGWLTYVEIKTSPPKHIEIKEVSSFLDRLDVIKPNLSIFLEDTKLRMKDKIVPMFEDALKKRFRKKKISHIKRLKNELFYLNENIFIINSYRDIKENLGFCISYFLSSEKSFPIARPV